MRLATLAVCLLLTAGCASTTRAGDISGLKDTDGKAFVHQSTFQLGLHWAFGAGPSLGPEATLESAVALFTKAAKSVGASQVRIVQSDRSNYWWVLPPLSFILTPVTTEVAGDTR